MREWLLSQGVKAAGHSDDVMDAELEMPPVHQRSKQFYEAVRLAIVDDPSCPRVRQTFTAERGVVPVAGRREGFLLAGGWWPTFFPNHVVGPDEDERRVHVYIDASGSTYHLWPFLFGLVLHLREEIGEPIWMFSNVVRGASLDDLREGRIHSTGGTDFDCIIEHALSRRFRRILIVTDGIADIDQALARKMKLVGMGVFLVLTEEYGRCPLIPLARKMWVIPDLMDI